MSNSKRSDQFSLLSAMLVLTIVALVFLLIGQHIRHSNELEKHAREIALERLSHRELVAEIAQNRFGPNHPQVKELLSEIAAMKTELDLPDEPEIDNK